MAREILFKAKRLDNGEWVEGYYANCYFPTSDVRTGHFIIEYPGEYHEIYTETLCQCTGRKDKNGTLIWENDIVTEDFGNFKGIVRFGEFEAQVLKNIGFCIEWKDIYYRQDLCYWAEKCEIIGNIFDNPDLLEEKHE